LIRKACLAVFCVAIAFGADNHTETATETVIAHDEDIIPLHASVRETTLIVLPASEKARVLRALDGEHEVRRE
jgi:hypothetical protein